MNSRPLVGAICAYFFLFGFGLATWASRLPVLQSACGLSNSELGIALFLGSVGAFTAVPTAAYIIARLSSRRAALSSCLLYAFLIYLLSSGNNGIVLALIFFAMGMTSGLLDVAINTQAVAAEKQSPKPMMSTFHALFSLGMAGGGFLGGVLAAVPVSTHFAAVLLFVGLAAFATERGFMADAPCEVKTPGFTFPKLGGAIFWLSCIAFCSMLAEGAITEWSTTYMLTVAHASAGLAPQAITAFAIAMTAGRLTGDSVRARFGDLRVLRYGAILGAAGLALATAIPSPSACIAGTFLSGLGLSILVPICFSAAGKVPAARAEVSLAQVTTIGYLGFMTGPPIIGTLSDLVGLRSALAVVPVALLLSLIALRLAFRPQPG